MQTSSYKYKKNIWNISTAARSKNLNKIVIDQSIIWCAYRPASLQGAASAIRGFLRPSLCRNTFTLDCHNRVHQVRLTTHPSTPPRLAKAASGFAYGFASGLRRTSGTHRSSSWQNRVALRVADGRPRRALRRCVSRTFTNAQRVIGHTDAWCEAAFARKGAL